MAEERLHKVLAQAGIASRRHAEELILAGRVHVNGEVVETLGAKVDPDRDTVEVDGQKVKLESKIYLALNKPRGYISDRDETGEHRSALDLVPNGERLFAAGRLDLDSEGLLLLTNDGELTFRLTHPRYEHEKEYLALVGGLPNAETLQRMKRGVIYQDTIMRADRAALAERHQPFGEAGREQTWLRIVLHEGKKREIRHMCAALGHPVLRLVRVRIGPIELGKLKLAQSRPLTGHEIHALKQTTSQLAPRPGKRPTGANKPAEGPLPPPGPMRRQARSKPADRPLPPPGSMRGGPRSKPAGGTAGEAGGERPRAGYARGGAQPGQGAARGAPRGGARPGGSFPTGPNRRPTTQGSPHGPAKPGGFSPSGPKRKPTTQGGPHEDKSRRPARPARQQQKGRSNNPRRGK